MHTTMKTQFSLRKSTSVMLGFALLATAFTSCEDSIDVDLDEGTIQLSVDAFLTNVPGEQRIVLTETTPYFDNTTQRFAAGAIVKVTDDLGKVYNFSESNQGGGLYTWGSTTPDSTMAFVGRTYTLSIDFDGSSYESSSTVSPVPPVDSVTLEFREEELGQEEGYYATFYAKDIPNQINYYWIRTLRNGEFYNDAEAINTSVDGAFGSNGADGFLFIIPIREFQINDSENPYEEGDKVEVELWAISDQTWAFFGELGTQLTNNGLFATPAANIRTNIVNSNPNSDIKGVGWFSVSAISSNSAIAGQ